MSDQTDALPLGDGEEQTFSVDEAQPIEEVVAQPVPSENIDNNATDTTQTSEEKPAEEVNQPNAQVTSDWTKDPVDQSKFVWRFSFPSIGLFPFNTKIQQFKNLSLDGTSPGMKAWKKTNEEAIDYYTPGAIYQDRFTDSSSAFDQGVKTKEGELKTMGSLKFKDVDGELKGELAVLKVSKALGLGDVLSIPLPHSGIWVTIKPPAEKDLIDFYNSIFKDKIALGRSTYGLTLTNFSVYVNMKLFNFIMKHVHNTNNQDISRDDLDKYVLIHDFPILAWGFAATIYPNGFDYQRACVNDVEQCNHVVKAVLNMCKLLWIDNNSLTEAQKVILAETRKNKLNAENYRKFISEHVRVTSSEFTVNDTIKFKLRIPTFAEYTSDGLTWVNKINSAIESFIVEEGDEAEAKNQLLDQYVRASILRQFSHFVDYIEIDENVMTDRGTINEVLEVFSADDTLRATITNKILEFKANTTIGLVGIPDFKCPNCGAPQNNESVPEHMTSVIPLDVMNIFFTLITLRISKIMEREV